MAVLDLSTAIFLLWLGFFEFQGCDTHILLENLCKIGCAGKATSLGNFLHRKCRSD